MTEQPVKQTKAHHSRPMKTYENQSTCGPKSDLTKPLPHQINTNQSSTSNTFQYHQPSMNQPKEALPSDNCVCDRGANVRAHDDWDCLLDRQHISPNQTNDDTRAC